VPFAPPETTPSARTAGGLEFGRRRALALAAATPAAYFRRALPTYSHQPRMRRVRRRMRRHANDVGTPTNAASVSRRRHDASPSEKDAVESERDPSLKQRDAPPSRRAASVSEKDPSLSRRDGAESEKAPSLSRRDGAESEKAASLSRRDGAESEKAASLSRRDGAEGERAASLCRTAAWLRESARLTRSRASSSPRDSEARPLRPSGRPPRSASCRRRSARRTRRRGCRAGSSAASSPGSGR
jgi:hypothetical protein